MNSFIFHKKPVAAYLKITMLFVLFSALFNLNAKAQQKPETSADTSKIYTAADEGAEFPGGMASFYHFLQKNTKYPAAARQNKTHGTVIITFVVEKDGSLTNIKVVRGIGGGCDEEAIRVLSSSPKWNPGKNEGKVVRQQWTVPISFNP